MIEGAGSDEFIKLVQTLQPYLPQIVFVGGWAQRLFPLHALAMKPDFVPLTTKDADVVVPSHLVPSSETLRDRLETSGFKEELSGEERPPVAHYFLGDGGFYVEFLAPKLGGDSRSRKSGNSTVRISGVNAQKLRHVDLLLIEPWRVSIGPDPDNSPLEIQIPNAATYVAQKLLVLTARRKETQGNDIVHIHDTIMVFGHKLKALRDLWTSLRQGLTSKLVKQVAEAAQETFQGVNDRIREAVIIARATGRSAPPNAEEIAKRCNSACQEIFGLNSPASRSKV